MTEVHLSAFLDECTRPRSSDGEHIIPSVADQLFIGQALGLSRWVPRSFNFGTPDRPDIVNVGELTSAQMAEVLDAQRSYGFTAHCMGSALGKGVKLVDAHDGSSNVYWEPKRYHDEVVYPTVARALQLRVSTIRIFSFHHPKGSDSREYVAMAVERLVPIVEYCNARRIVPLLEIEAGLVGDRGVTCAAIYEQFCRSTYPRKLLLVWDPGNVYSQGLDLWAEWQVMGNGVGEIHAKFYDGPRPKGFGPIDEDALLHYVPAGTCSAGTRQETYLYDFHHRYEEFRTRLGRALAGVGADCIPVQDLTLVLEPHLLGGGKYGGKSGAIGMGAALRSLCRVLDYVGFNYHLHGYHDVLAARAAMLERKSRPEVIPPPRDCPA